MSSTKRNPTLRLRVFAGPNGSGKSTIIEAVRKNKVNGIPIDFGIYINADDITRALKANTFSLKRYKIIGVTKETFVKCALESGLINDQFPEKNFLKCFKIQEQNILLQTQKYADHLAQVIADFLRKQLLLTRKKFSFETVFSHESKLDIMRQAIQNGYKVYLYFVATESPEINKYRVKVRVQEHGHDVPSDRIESRYYRSLNLLFDAAQLSYQTYFFDNSNEEFKIVAHFKMEKGKKAWDPIDTSKVPNWFIKYYSEKVSH